MNKFKEENIVECNGDKYVVTSIGSRGFWNIRSIYYLQELDSYCKSKDFMSPFGPILFNGYENNKITAEEEQLTYIEDYDENKNSYIQASKAAFNSRFQYVRSKVPSIEEIYKSTLEEALECIKELDEGKEDLVEAMIFAEFNKKLSVKQIRFLLKERIKFKDNTLKEFIELKLMHNMMALDKIEE